MHRLPGLHGLRGLAALAVVLFHAVFVLAHATPDWTHPVSDAALRYGWTGVDLFFVLSGFLLALPYVGPGRAARPAYRTYAANRVLRIAPPYYATIALTALVLPATLGFRPALSEAWRHLMYLHNTSPETIMAVNPVFWTLAIEMQFYLLLPLVAPLFARRSWPLALGAALLATLAWRLVLFAPGDAQRTFWMTAQVPGFAFHFALGMAAARLHTHGFRLPRPAFTALTALFLSVALPLHLFDATHWFGAADPVTSLVVRPLAAIGYAVLVLAAVDDRAALAHPLEWRPLQALGERSYSLYLIHYPLMVALVAALPILVTVPLPLFYGIMAAASILGAAAFFALVEAPSLRLKQAVRDHLGRRTRTPEPRPAASDTAPATAAAAP